MRTLILSLMLVACIGLPMYAQKSDTFFGNDELYNDRDDTNWGYLIGTQGFGSGTSGGYNITTQQFGQELPLGEGLLVMVAAGAVYVVRKRKRKRGSSLNSEFLIENKR